MSSFAFKLSLSLGFWCYNVNKKSIDGLVKRLIVQRFRALGGCRFDRKGEYKRSLFKRIMKSLLLLLQ